MSTTARFVPARRARLVQEPRRRRGYSSLTTGEEQRLLLAAGPHLKDCIIATLESGMRRGEILGLQSQDVQEDERGTPEWIVLRAEVTKTGRSRTIPVTAQLAALLMHRRLDPNGERFGPDAYVFGNEVGEPIASFKTAWNAACRRAKIKDLHFHDLRREAASRQYEDGMPLHHVRDLLGHQDIDTTNTYLAVTPMELKRSMERTEKMRRSTRRAR